MEDPASQAIVFYGGAYSPLNETANEFADMWSWDGTDWHRAQIATSPKGLAGSYVYLPLKRELLMSFNGNPMKDSGTYRWDETTWTRVSDATFPEGAVAADAGTGMIISYDGRQHGCITDPCWNDLSRTETSDGVNWTLFSGAAPEPAKGNLVTDPTDSGVLMLNELGHTWIWANGQWHERATKGPSLTSNGFLYSDGTGVWFQTEPDYPQQRWLWDGRVWEAKTAPID